mmetsp:Transcript_4422/g.11598  ORF Transcript_4422/g.11598 Transcript_4422/m.11598 type:complete len:233 (-) Transcript_4422:864-1562(-)
MAVRQRATTTAMQVASSPMPLHMAAQRPKPLAHLLARRLCVLLDPTPRPHLQESPAHIMRPLDDGLLHPGTLGIRFQLLVVPEHGEGVHDVILVAGVVAALTAAAIQHVVVMGCHDGFFPVVVHVVRLGIVGVGGGGVVHHVVVVAVIALNGVAISDVAGDLALFVCHVIIIVSILATSAIVHIDVAIAFGSVNIVVRAAIIIVVVVNSKLQVDHVAGIISGDLFSAIDSAA